MELQDSVATVVRVLRYDTMMIRCACPMLQSQITTYMTPAGVWCDTGADDAMIDWVECHADAERLRLVPMDWMRDDCGRLIADLADLQSGELLTNYLVERGAAKPRPHHLLEAMHQMMHAKEPE